MREVLSLETPFKPGEVTWLPEPVCEVEQQGQLRHIEQGWRLYSEIRQ
jgi:hypothetical protein